MDVHGLDPARQGAPERVDASDLCLRLETHAQFLEIASPRLDALFGLVGWSGCAVLLTDADGIVLEQRVKAADAPVFDSWGLSKGADWSEKSEGTNGIGTCLTERRRVIIDRDDHFFARNTGMSCIDAPIFGPEGQVLAALDVSSARADQTEAFNNLIAAQVTQTARYIEEAMFRLTYASARIVVAEGTDAEAATLLAIDSDDLVIGATKDARRVFSLDASGTITPKPASDILGRTEGPSGFEKAERAAVVRALARTNGNVSAAARHLGIGRATLYRRMKRLQLDDKRGHLSQG